MKLSIVLKLLCFIAATAVLVSSTTACWQSKLTGAGIAVSETKIQQNDDKQVIESFDPVVVNSNKLPAIKNIGFRSRLEADAILRGSELVLGVEIDGRSRAYPINMLTGPTREAINDELNGVAIAATW